MTVIKEWNGSAWVPIVVGKQGPQGDTGLTGATGGVGPQGPAGVVVYDDDQNILAHQVFS
jgi:hypothetical protein